MRSKHLGLACRLPVCDLCGGKEEMRGNEAGQLRLGG